MGNLIFQVFLKNNERCNNCTRWSFRSSDTWGLEYESSVDTAAPRTLKVGTWTPTAGVEMFDELFLHVAHGFRSKNLQLVTIHNPPWQIISVDQSENKTRYKGLVFDIIEELAKKLNFTYSVKVIRSFDPADKTNVSSTRLAFDHGYDNNEKDLPDVDTNCIPTEVIDMITNKSVAIGAFVATISEKYLHLLEFTSPISTQSYSFLVARPKELSRALLFMAPFSGDTWLCLLLALLVMVPILYYVHKSSLQLQSRKDGELVTFQNCAWFIYGAMLQQGGMHIITVDSARILVGIWWLVVLVISTTYCGNLVAFLTFPVIDTSLSTFHDLLIHKDKISWTLAGGSFLEEHIKSIGDSSYKYLYSMKSNKKRNLESIADVISGRHVLIDWKIRLEYLLWREYIQSKKCELAIGNDEIFAENLGLVMSVNNPYLLRINREIKQLHQVGLIHKWLMAYLPKEKECWKYGQIFKANNHVVNIEDMQGSFFVLLLGTFFSLVLITGEFIWFHFTTVKKSHKNIKPFAR
ncbi:hypothetical protein WA026_010146 [Henosepilachna vigintioctopunctata]|uniref:Ionotropic glutamate receptor C-terminal domain-containing protein n=1 Tax=Henosepilachna vigintioctopunctata TaxID=420089 RepID=A0AAW1UGH8_9CUCU